MSDVNDMLADIRERVVRVETKIDNMTDVRDVAEEASKTAHEALKGSKSAHYRLNDVSDNQKWLWRTVVGAIIASAIGALLF